MVYVCMHVCMYACMHVCMCRDAVGGVVYAALKGDEDAMIKMVRGKSL